MPSAIFTSLSGMNAFRTGLDVVSNNVANMNSPGFKRSDTLFHDLVQQAGGSSGSAGAGVQAAGAAPSFQQGDARDTGNSLDAQIDGEGLFVLDKDGQRMYTRAGQFEFDKDGFLVERGSGAKVLVSTDSVALTYFDRNTVRVFPPRATAEVTMSGTLARGGTTTTYELPEITVIDTSGAKQTLKARFTRDAADPLHWTLEIVNADNKVLGSGAVRFNADGTPAKDASSVTVSITTKNDTPAFDVAFNLGAPNTYGGVTSVSGTTTSQLQMLKQDGVELGSITATEFDEHGQLQITYSNGEKKTPVKLVLAGFDALDQMKPLGNSHFVVATGHEPSLGSALVGGMGRVQGGKIEMSNVDLTDQFTNLILLQRGFQGSSQITTAANEMMQQLLAMSGNK
jgi:flagellar hook protein FlgE